MKTFEYNEDINIDVSCICDNPEDILFFDIETTGLSPASSDLYLIGMGYYKAGAVKTIFLFNDDGCSEPEMLSLFSSYIHQYKYIVSYNGDTFDIPYMQTKFTQFDIDCSFKDMESIDIYKTTRKYKKLFNMKSMKQVDAEELTGFRRSIFISGGNLIKTYKEYLKNKSARLLEDLMTHNHDDIKGLISITYFLNLPGLCNKMNIVKIIRTASDIEYTCRIPHLPCRVTYASKDMRLNGIDDEIRVCIPVIHDKLKFYFKDYKNYYYLPLEDMAIHKSMAAYVDKDHKIKATKENAYTQLEADFVPAPKGEKENIFYKPDLDGDTYIQLSSDLECVCDTAKDYIAHMLRHIF